MTLEQEYYKQTAVQKKQPLSGHSPKELGPIAGRQALHLDPERSPDLVLIDQSVSVLPGLEPEGNAVPSGPVNAPVTPVTCRYSRSMSGSGDLRILRSQPVGRSAILTHSWSRDRGRSLLPSLLCSVVTVNNDRANA